MCELEDFTAQAIKEMESLKKETTEKVICGSCSNMEQYKAMTSRIETISDCQKLLTDILRSINES